MNLFRANAAFLTSGHLSSAAVEATFSTFSGLSGKQLRRSAVSHEIHEFFTLSSLTALTHPFVCVSRVGHVSSSQSFYFCSHTARSSHPPLCPRLSTCLVFCRASRSWLVPIWSLRLVTKPLKVGYPLIMQRSVNSFAVVAQVSVFNSVAIEQAAPFEYSHMCTFVVVQVCCREYVHKHYEICPMFSSQKPKRISSSPAF